MFDLFILQLEILWPAFVAGLLVLSTHIPFGREVLQRGIIFLDLAIAQIAGLGVVLANTTWVKSLWGHDHGHTHASSQTLVAVVTAVMGSLLLYRLRRLPIRVQEALIGILFILSATASLMLLSADPHGAERMKEILVGQILWVRFSDLLWLAAAYAVVLIIWFGFSSRWGAWLFYPLFATTITLSTQVVGVYLVFASLIIPALAVFNRPHFLKKAYLLGFLGYFIGLLFSAFFDLPAGAVIVWALSVVAGAYYYVTRRSSHT